MSDVSPIRISDTLLAKLGSFGVARDYVRNETVLTEGDPSQELHVLVSGELKVYTKDAKGRELVFNSLRPGEIFGEMFLDGGVRSASVKAIIDSRCIAIESARIHELIRSDPDFAVGVVQSLIARLRNATQLSKGLALRRVHERVVDLLNEVAQSEGDIRFVPIEITQQEMADRVGATREMINHIIRDLMRDGAMRRDEQRRLTFNHNFPQRW